MFEGRRILTVVPARGGSKGIPLKNLREICGLSLVARAGMTAARIDAIDRSVVSTDHQGIAEAAEQVGLSAPFRRPESLSGDRIGDWDVLHNALLEMEALDAATYDIVVMLQPTSPGRRAEHVMETLRVLVEGQFDAVWSVSQTDSKGHPLKQLLVAPDRCLDYCDSLGSSIIARQQLQPVYHRNGIAYAITRECLVTQKTIKGARTGAVVIEGLMPNIDTEIDLEWAEFIFHRYGDPLVR